MKIKAGFTLIEIMVSLVLVGLIASIAGTSVVTATRSYLFARENNAITQKAQLALNRLSREFIELSNVTANSSSDCISYESPYGKRAIAKVGNTVQYFVNPGSGTTCSAGSDGDILVDSIQNFIIKYNGAASWSTSQDIRSLSTISFNVELLRQDTGGTVSFETIVSPRNNNNAGGAASPSISNPPPEYSGKQCFVTTAAYGNPDHPVVEIFRQFRDRILLPTGPGKTLVRFYYEVGPSLAAAIEGSPIACLFVRLLLTPVAGFAFLALSCPVLIPVILLLSLGLACLALRALRRRSLRWKDSLQGQRGAMLVTLIAAMVVFAALGAVMIGMFGTSALSQVAGNTAMKAYYLAESGFRYAASRYISVNLGSESANETARETLMESELSGKTFSLGSDGVFRLDVYPYYYKSAQAPNGNELTAKVFGSIPMSSSNFNWGSWVKIVKPDGTTTTYNRISGASTLAPSTVRFYQIDAGGTPLNWDASYWDATHSKGSLITPVCLPDRDVNSLKLISNADGSYDLAFKAGTGALAFPEKNGIFMVTFQGETSPRILSYLQRDITNSRLKGIRDPNGGSLPTGMMINPGTGTPPTNSYIELTKFMRVESTGTIGTGTSAVSRQITYYTPIGYAKAQPVPKTQFHDKMLDFSNWLTGYDISRIGTVTAGTSYGTTMAISAAQATYTLPGGSCLKFKEFQAGLNWSGAGIPIQQEWLRAGDYLSYDVEMKTYYTLINPQAKFAFGLTFRLDEQGNALGFSLSRGVPGSISGCDNDGIPFELSGYNNFTPYLVFWMKEYAKKETNLLVESFTHSVTPTKFDDLPPVGTGTYAIRTSKPASYWQNGDRVRLTSTGGSLPVGIVAGKDYFIRKVIYGSLTYLFLFDTLVNSQNTVAPYWTGLQDITAVGSGTTTIIVQDPTFTKLAHQVLNSSNGYLNLIASLSYVKSFVTLMARVIEAPSVSFVNGGGATGHQIMSGDTVYQTSSNDAAGTVTAIYRLARNPYYRDYTESIRNWSGNAAQGVMVLEPIQGNPASVPATSPFTSGKKIFAGEPPGGVWAATVGVPGGITDQAFRARNNWLQFYVGDPTGNAPADADPFNNYRGPVLRNSVLWPPDNAEDTAVNNDNFTLLRFSDYINSSYCTWFGTKNNTMPEGGDILRFTSPDGSEFYSPQSGVVFPTGRAEVGLHAYGDDGHFTEFDDFGLQFGPGYGITRQGFLLPIQQ
jgi:prepilin-type N-terminal cleavage/methylation domain-containing protein